MKILVVDDETAIRNVLKEFLNLKGFKVYTASNASIAIAKVKSVRPHIVLLDIMMPGVGGMEILKQIKRIEPAAGVIMVTAIYDNELARRAFSLGAYDYLTKPVDFNYLETVLMVKSIDFWVNP